ncbi:MAG: putative collagen-binding domain-containing protein, partial [Bythopirellula sp.]
IWHPEGNPQEDAPTAKRYFRKVFDLEKNRTLLQGLLRVAPDEDAIAFLNNRRIGRQHGYDNVLPMTIPAELFRVGRNVLAIEVDNQASKKKKNPAGLLCTLGIEFSNGQSTTIGTDRSWRSATKPVSGWAGHSFDDVAWQQVLSLGSHGAKPWGFVRARGELGQPYSAGIPGQLRIIYLPTSERAIVNKLETGVFYEATYFDPKTAEATVLGAVTADTQGSWRPPLPPQRAQDWVLILERIRKTAEHHPISIHPENPKYFLFRAKPLTLITATEHYGSVVNSAFDFAAYLNDMAEKKQTVTRTFLLFREQQTERNPHSPIKPESTEYLTPYLRTTKGQAEDGEPLYDLNQWNPQFFDRLDRFLTQASELGIVVELTLFGNVYRNGIWKLNPLHDDNNIQEMGDVQWHDFITLRDEPLVMRQKAYVEKIVQETCQYDNVYYEICNEAGGDHEGGPKCAEVDAWQHEMARVARAELDRLGHRHLIAGSQAFNYSRGYRQGLDHALSAPWVQVLNFHSYPKIDVDGETWEMGGFMTKDLLLSEIAGLCRALQSHPKPCSFDEDNVTNLYENETGWTIQRKRAWATIMGQVHYDFIDFSVTVGHETGTDESQRNIRTWMKYLSEFFHSFDFIHAKPVHNWLVKKPENVFESVLAVPGADYIAYLADQREVADFGAGQTLRGAVAFLVPQGRYQARLYSPTTGHYSPALSVLGGTEPIELELVDFRHDVVLRVTRDD